MSENWAGKGGAVESKERVDQLWSAVGYLSEDASWHGITGTFGNGYAL